MLLPIHAILTLVFSDNHLGHNVVFIQKRVMSHDYSYANVIVPVPAVN